ncbi:MAG: integrase core domain-containing protein [Bacteroidales bacterium]|nr:integrase core domain-containing protein [Candidatus Latescibacterota bacterium]
MKKEIRDYLNLQRKLATWEEFYNFNRPHGAHKGKTPYEALRSMLE